MTPQEMRRKANRNRTEANVLEESAHTLRAVAISVRGLLSGLVGISRMVWQGPAASRFEQEAEAHNRNLEAQADDIAGEAAGFDRRAAALRSEANRLVVEAARIEAAQAAAAPGAS
jgi:hypothetical protein